MRELGRTSAGRAEHARGRKTFVSPSPGDILKRQAARTGSATPVTSRAAIAPTEIAGNPFRTDVHADAMNERGVMLSPIVVEWHYRVPAARPFAKWLRTKDIILSDARLGLTSETAGVHYFGTYIAEPDARSSAEESQPTAVACRTIWGFGNEAAMTALFDLARGNIERISIVQTDLRDFILGLKQHVHQAGAEHFRQEVLVSSAVV